MAMKLDEGDDVALWAIRLPVFPMRRDPLRTG